MTSEDLAFPTLITPDTPDLGGFVRQGHEFELDANFHPTPTKTGLFPLWAGMTQAGTAT